MIGLSPQDIVFSSGLKCGIVNLVNCFVELLASQIAR